MNRENQDLENARVKYTSVLSIKNSEGEIQWNRYNAILVANTIFVSLFSFAANSDGSAPILKIVVWVIPIFGIVLCFLWYIVTKRGFLWSTFWIKKANEIESQIKGKINPIQEGKELRDMIGPEATKKAAVAIIIIFIVLYVFMFLSNFLPLQRTNTFNKIDKQFRTIKIRP